MDLISAHLSDISAVSFSSSKTPLASSFTKSSDTSQSQISVAEDVEYDPIRERQFDASEKLQNQQPFLPTVVSTPTHQPLGVLANEEAMQNSMGVVNEN